MSRTVHVVPVADLIAHTVPGWPHPDKAADGHESGWVALEAAPDLFDLGECPCGPAWDLEVTDRGDGWLVVHAALDGRERRERAA